MSIIIKKAQLKGSRGLNLTYEQPVVNGKDIVSIKCANRVHPDLVVAMDKLIPHMVLLCELPEESELRDRLNHRSINDCTEGFTKVVVTGISIGGGDDEESGVTIIGNRLLGSNGKTLNLVSPFQKYDTEEYFYAEKLEDAVKEIVSEITQFLDGKVGEEQLDIFDEQNNGDNPFAAIDEVVVDDSNMQAFTDATKNAIGNQAPEKKSRKKKLEPAA